MGILSETVRCLTEGGFRAQRAYPGGNRMAITGVVAAVQLENMDHSGATVRVNVLSSGSMGGGACEDGAIRILQILQAAGGVCNLEKCGYLTDAEAFCTPVIAFFAGEETDGVWIPAEEPAEPEKSVFTLTVGGVALKNAVSFTAQRATDEMVLEIGNALWHFTLEESLPLDSTEAAVPEESFIIVVTRQGRTETYTDCILTQQKRVLTGDGLRQIRTGVAGAVTVS